MLLTNESPKMVCMLAALLVTRKAKSRVLIITDSARTMEPDYLSGPGKFFDIFTKQSVAFTVQRASCRLRLKNDSTIDFVPLRCETDLDRLRGVEAELIAIDHQALITIKMLNIVRSRDRTGFSMDDLKRLQTAEIGQVH